MARTKKTTKKKAKATTEEKKTCVVRDIQLLDQKRSSLVNQLLDAMEKRQIAHITFTVEADDGPFDGMLYNRPISIDGHVQWVFCIGLDADYYDGYYDPAYANFGDVVGINDPKRSVRYTGDLTGSITRTHEFEGFESLPSGEPVPEPTMFDVKLLINCWDAIAEAFDEYDQEVTELVTRKLRTIG